MGALPASPGYLSLFSLKARGLKSVPPMRLASNGRAHEFEAGGGSLMAENRYLRHWARELQVTGELADLLSGKIRPKQT